MMETFHVKGALGRSAIHVGEHLENVHQYLPDRQCFIITDDNVFSLYADKFPKAAIITIGTGEEIKTLATVEFLSRQLAALGCDRQSFILGIGGGIVCDITGFVASVYMRGVAFGFVSTTLLSQVDASVGGKNGVNLDSYKNMVGVFSQPEFVLCDISLLHTLPEKEISNGLAEIVKHGLIRDPKLFSFLETHAQAARDLDSTAVFRMVRDSVCIKSAVVQADEKEGGLRRILNFGHTIGHAMEKIEPRGHGRAVSMGMMAALQFSMEHKRLKKDDIIDRTGRLLARLGLPVSLDASAADIIQGVSLDKKKQGDHLFFVFLEDIGTPLVEKITFETLNRFIHRAFQ